MTSSETSLGGPHLGFCTTLWSDILAAGGTTTEASRGQLDALIRIYWKPVYAYIRSSGRLPIEDAKDLTQAFFTRFLEKNYWASARPERGSFRGYLKRAVKNFLINAARDARSAPTGFSIDPRDLPAAVPDESPDAAYDREWLATLLDASWADLRHLLVSEGKPHYADIFKAYCLTEHDSDAPTYDELAATFKLQKHDIRNILFYCRKTFRLVVKQRVRQTVDSDDATDVELAEMMR